MVESSDADETDGESGRKSQANADSTVSETSGETVETQDPITLAESHPVLLFDGVCNLCNRWIQFVINRDPEATFRFAPLQSRVAQELLAGAGYEGETLDSVVLIDDGNYYDKSDAVIRTARHLGGVYRLLGPFGLFPARLRNIFYDFVAARRYRWFGKREACMMPTPENKKRFLAGGPGPD